MTLVEFIRSWPDKWPHPDECIVVDYHDKDYSLDWDFGKGKMVSVSIAQNGDIIWAAMIGEEKFHGTSKTAKEIPKELIDIFKKMGY